jgi:precorrin-6B methylase 2
MNNTYVKVITLISCLALTQSSMSLVSTDNGNQPTTKNKKNIKAIRSKPERAPQAPELPSEEYLNFLYKAITGFGINDNEISEIKKEGGDATYGEIIYDSAKRILNDLSLTKDDIVYDLGCGIGKLVVQVYLTTPVKKSVGIELSPTRFNHAQTVKEQLKKRNKLKNGRILEFLNQNITKANLDDATVIYMASTCFSDELMKTLVDKLAKNKNNLRIITLKRLPKHLHFQFIKEYNLPMTWSQSVPVYLYKLKHTTNQA